VSDYTKTTNFTAKDSLETGNPLKLIKGADFDTEFDNIVTAVATKSESASPTFTGTTSIATLSVSGNATITGTITASSIDGGTY
jgi:hypothetical protein